MHTTEIENFHKNIELLKIPIKLFRPIFKNNLSEEQEQIRINLAGYIHSLFLSSQSDVLKLDTKKQPFLLDFIFRTTKTKFQKELYFLLKDELKHCRIEMEQFLYNENDLPAYGPIDIVITLPDGKKIAVECDGESHDAKDSAARDIAIIKLTQTNEEQVNYYVIKHKTSDNPQEFDKIKEILKELKKREKAITDKNRQQRSEIKQKKPAPIEIKKEATKDVEAEEQEFASVATEPSEPQNPKKITTSKKGEKEEKEAVR